MSKAAVLILLMLALSFYARAATENNHVNKIDSLNTKAYEQINNRKTEEALEILNISKKLIDKHQYQKGDAEYNLLLGWINIRKKKYSECFKYFSIAKDLKEYFDDKILNKGLLWKGLALMHDAIGNIEKADAYYEKGLKYFSELGDIEKTYDLYSKWGIFYGKRGLYNECLEYLFMGYKALQQQNPIDNNLLGDHYSNLAIVYNRKNERETAKKYAFLSLNTFTDEYELSGVYNTIGGIYNFERKVDSAQYYYKLSYDYAAKHENTRMISIAAINMFEIYSREFNQPDSALAVLKNAETLANQMNSNELLSDIYASYARHFLRLENYERASFFSRKAIPYMQKTENILELKEIYDWLSIIKTKDQQYDSALYFHKVFKKLNDSIYNISNERKFSRLNVKLETLEKENEIAKLNTSLAINRTRIIFLIVLLILLIIAILFSYKFYITESKRKDLQLQNAELSKNMAEQNLKQKETQLADYTLKMLHKNQFISQLEHEIIKDKKKINADSYFIHNELLKKLKYYQTTKKDWENFNKYFGSIHQDFFHKMKNKYPELTKTDLRHCALIRLNMTLKESAEILGVSYSSVKVTRSRIKKKLNIGQDTKISEILTQIQ